MFRRLVSSFAGKIQTKPVKIIIPAVAGIALIGYVLLFAVPKTIIFSYSDATCIDELTVLPHQRRENTPEGFSINYKKEIGQLAALQTCFTPTSVPQEGSTTITSAVFGWSIFQNHYTVTVAPAPRVVGYTTEAPVAVSKPLLFAIDTPDIIFDYEASSDTKSVPCTISDKNLSCDMRQLSLAQGAEHIIRLLRSFKGRDKTVVTNTKVSILPAATVTGSSIKAGQTIYDMPRSFNFTLSKPLISASAKLERVDGGATTLLDTAVATNTTSVTVTVSSDLAREKQYRLTLTNAEATDGSTLNEPYSVAFTTSGGPKVTGINIATSGVDPNARIVVSFDQAIASTVDITKFASISGANAAISRQGSQVIFVLQSATRCAGFSLRLTKGIASAVNNEVSKNDWSYTSRVNCRATSVIGYSVKGRPITAYYYGSGATTILFTGGMHGSEPSGQQTMQAWATYLDAHAPEIPTGKQVVIVPNTNPDGIATHSRYNVNGVNIDRNFDTTDWKTDIDTSSGMLAGGGGPTPMSEPETRAIANLTAQVNPRVEVSFHASGRLVGANDYGDSRSIGALYASTVGYSTMFGSSAEDVMGYSFSGQYEDWIAQHLGKPAILIELPSSSGNYLNSQLPALWKMVNL